MPTLIQTPKSKTAAADALVGLWAVALAAFLIATLYFARPILIPLALAVLLTFLLSPLVTRIERWIGRIAAVLVVVTMIFTVTSVTGWVLTRQFVDLATKLPDYKVNIQTKLRSFKVLTSGAVSRLSQTVEELKKDLPGAASPTIVPTLGKPESATIPANAAQGVPGRAVEISKVNPMELAQSIIAPLLDPLGTGALVSLLVICMLLQREDLRSRLIRLIGQDRVGFTTRAMDEAGARVSRYLLMQLVVNITYGIAIAVGLYFIGVPNAVLWGVVATVMRFIPYIGPWIAAVFPIMLSLAVSTSWTMPLLTISLFGVLELLSNNVMEPWLYGSNTGVSSIALIVAAVFWTWLWGPIGLVLATPLTVCLVVMGRHVPSLRFLSILLSDEEALTPAEECYHRLLVGDLNRAGELVDSYVETNSLTALYDSVLIPVVTFTEMDYRREALDNEQCAAVKQGVRDIVEDLGTRPAPESKIDADVAVAEHTPPPAPAPASRVYCLPARADRDELAGRMLAHLLREQGFHPENAPAKLVADDPVKIVEQADVDAVCISVVAPSTVIHARYLCAKLRAQSRDLKIAVGLWGATENIAVAAQRLRESGADEVVTTLADAVVQLAKLAPPTDLQMTAAPIPLTTRSSSSPRLPR